MKQNKLLISTNLFARLDQHRHMQAAYNDPSAHAAHQPLELLPVQRVEQHGDVPQTQDNVGALNGRDPLNINDHADAHAMSQPLMPMSTMAPSAGESVQD